MQIFKKSQIIPNVWSLHISKIRPNRKLMMTYSTRIIIEKNTKFTHI